MDLTQYHAACDEFARGDPEPVKQLYAHRDDVILANPFGPPVRGWNEASKALDFASSRFRGGQMKTTELLGEFETADLSTVFEIERWEAKVSGREEMSVFVLRVTSTFRRENGAWKLVLRHADPIMTADSDGPVRKSSN